MSTYLYNIIKIWEYWDNFLWIMNDKKNKKESQKNNPPPPHTNIYIYNRDKVFKIFKNLLLTSLLLLIRRLNLESH